MSTKLTITECKHCGQPSIRKSDVCVHCCAAGWLIEGHNTLIEYNLDTIKTFSEETQSTILDRVGLRIGLAEPGDHVAVRTYIVAKRSGVSHDALGRIVECFNAGYTVESIQALLEETR